MTKWVVSDSDTRIMLHHQDPKLSQKGKEEWSKGKGMSALKQSKDLCCTLLFSYRSQGSFLKLPQGYFSHKHLGSKCNFEQHLFLKNWHIPAVWHLMIFLASNNTYSSLSSSLAWSLFVLILCVLVPVLVPWRRVADSPSGLKAGCVGVNSAFLWFFFSPAFVWLRLFTVFLLLTFLVLFFLRW